MTRLFFYVEIQAGVQLQFIEILPQLKVVSSNVDELEFVSPYDT